MAARDGCGFGCVLGCGVSITALHFLRRNPDVAALKKKDEDEGGH